MRLTELGVSHVFGVPGDYNLGFLDQVVNFSKIEWIGTCNELNGAYATDGYARIKGAGALLTTFGVGELSAINGIAGAYAEYVPIVNIVGIPSTPVREKKSIVHHTLGDGRFTVFSDMYKSITVAQTILNNDNAASEIDRVLTECWLRKRPVYIALPSDVSYLEIEAPKKPLDLSYPKSNKDAVNELVERAAITLEKAKHPVVLIDVCAQKHPMKLLILEFLEKTGIPFATMNMGKAIINESHAQFIGNYNGDFSSDGVQKKVEESDCIITFGSLMSDFNTGSFTAKINVNATIEIHGFHARVKQSVYDNALFCETIPALIHRLSTYHYQEKITSVKKIKEEQPQEIVICHKRFWNQVSHFLQKKSIILAEAGTSMFGTQQMHMPDDSTYIAQTLWGSIGYTVGALLGVCVAAPDRQAVLFVGDGSFQLTAQEISTMVRHDLTPTIFLLDNDGYTVERVIHGPTMPYNDVQHWDYTQFPKIFGKDVWSIQVNNEVELKNALVAREKNKDKLAFITVMMEKMDAPEVLIKIGKAVSELNKYTSK
ncbi:MAG: thiamine pyrophosphate-binding protein [Gammaproteobacteria bacterium]|nr:thiamine pyrophosphate-binding protein [Gammaproteobacteria bacterium]